MRTPSTHLFNIAQITLECLSPLSLKADESDPTLDNTLIRDVVGNPIIPGTSIAGVLSHLFLDHTDEKTHQKVFGYAQGKESQISHLQVGFGYVLDEKETPQKGTVTQLSQTQDSLLDFLKQETPILRDQVALNEYGTAKEIGKFDRTALPKGTRFQFEIGFASEEPEPDTWHQILSLMQHPKFRLGGLTHRGFGQIKVTAIKQAQLDFKNQDDFKKWQKFRHSQNWQDLQPEVKVTEKPNANFCTLTLKAEDFWRIGSGAAPLGNYDKIPDALPYTEQVIENGTLYQTPKVVIPATSIKGALRHRTLFHLRRLKQDYEGIVKEQEPALCQIFGASADQLKSESPNPLQGIGGLILNDLYLTEHSTPKVMMHNKIDRFTGGVIDGALFSEELLFEDTLNLEFYFDPKRLHGLDKDAQDAFIASLEDLAQGRLSIGAGSSKGHGYFQAETSTELETLIEQFQEACK